MTLDRLAITAMGMATSLGLDADTACAAARAGIRRARDIEEYFVASKDGLTMLPIKGHPVTWLSEGFSGFGRLARLGSLALSNLGSAGGLDEEELPKTGIFLALPSGYYPSMADHYGDDPAPADYRDEPVLALQKHLDANLVGTMFRLQDLPVPRRSSCFYADAAGFGMALEAAFAALSEGSLRFAIVGGIDSQLELHTLDALAQHALLKTPDNGFGFLPGEGAALLLLESTSSDNARERTPIAHIYPPAVVQEAGHHISDIPPNGRALSEAILGAASKLKSGGKSIGTLIGSHNGNPWFASEWGRARVRISRIVAKTRLWRTVDNFGETAAAMGAIGTCLAAKEVARHGAGHEALVWMSSPGGPKAALGLSD